MMHSNQTLPNHACKFVGSMTVEELKDYLDIDSNERDEKNDHNKNLMKDKKESTDSR